MRFRTVGEVSELTGVNVRTLHHYDEIGLLEPSERTAAGYRLYSEADLVRLHTVLDWRDMGFGLTDIARMLDDPDQDVATGLKRQRERLTERSDRLEEMIAALDAAIATIDRGGTMTDDDVKKGLRRLRSHSVRGGSPRPVGTSRQLRRLTRTIDSRTEAANRGS